MEESFNFCSIVPPNWVCYNNSEVGLNGTHEVTRCTPEYTDIENLFTKEGIKVVKIVRYELVYRYVQYLVRQQHLLSLHPDKVYYTARRYVRLRSSDLDQAITYHLDKRRNGRIIFCEDFTSGEGNVVIIVSTITTDLPDVVEDRESNYFIEYVVHLDG